MLACRRITSLCLLLIALGVATANAVYVETVPVGDSGNLDSDADGVRDDSDQCPDSPPGDPVNRATGCPTHAAGLDRDGDVGEDELALCASSSEQCAASQSEELTKATDPGAAISVPADRCLWLAGMPDGTDAGSGDVAPDASPVLMSNLPLVSGAVVRFTKVTGRATNLGVGPGLPPDGETQVFVALASPQRFGKSNVIAPLASLVGVFLDDQSPAGNGPAILDFSSAQGIDYLTVSPLLNQVFFIGDGHTSQGAQQSIIVPPGATRLYVGIMDAYEWRGNWGSFSVEAEVLDPLSDGGVPDSADLCAATPEAQVVDAAGCPMHDPQVAIPSCGLGSVQLAAFAPLFALLVHGRNQRRPPSNVG